MGVANCQMLGGGWPPHVPLWLHEGLTPLAQTLKRLPWPQAQSANLSLLTSACASCPNSQSHHFQGTRLHRLPALACDTLLSPPHLRKWTLTSSLAPLGAELLPAFQPSEPLPRREPKMCEEETTAGPS